MQNFGKQTNESVFKQMEMIAIMYSTKVVEEKASLKKI